MTTALAASEQGWTATVLSGTVSRDVALSPDGVDVTAVEETLKLPQTILMYPVTVASTVAHIVMKVQQDIAELVTKGDSALESIFPPRDEQPEWATFDEDYADDEAPAAPVVAAPAALAADAPAADQQLPAAQPAPKPQPKNKGQTVKFRRPVPFAADRKSVV